MSIATEVPQNRMPTDVQEAVEIAWLCGIFEGEGCFSVEWVKSPSSPYEYPHLRIIVQMTDLDVVERVQRIVGGGSVHQVATRPTGHRQLYRWEVGHRRVVVPLLERVMPHMGVRRRAKIAEMLAMVGTRRESMKA